MKKLLSKLSIVGLVLITLSACGGTKVEQKPKEVADVQFCKCLEATSNMDAESSKLMDVDVDISEEAANKVNELSAIMKTECKDYAEISKEEGLKLKALCEQQ